MRVNEVTRPEFPIDSEKGDGPIGHSLTTWFSHGEETMYSITRPAEEPRNRGVGEGRESAAHSQTRWQRRKSQSE